MKRLLIALILLVPGMALAFDTTPLAPRVGVLRAEQHGPADVARYLREELRARGLDAFDAELTYEELVREGAGQADYLVEIVADGGSSDYELGDVSGRNGFVGFSLVLSRVSAEVRVYDADTFEVLTIDTLKQRKTALLPTSAGVGGHSFFAAFAIPFVQDAQVRSAVRAAAREAAERVAVALAGR